MKSQKEIIDNWKCEYEPDKPIVSIICITYNHEPYIEQALIGFLTQKTDFPFEVLIHDDASTDQTANIIRKYEKAYPKIIKPIYQTENQYSKGVKISVTYNFPRAKGEYYAICEGDDYWIDHHKLQKQVDFLNNNPDYGLVHTECNILIESTQELIKNANKRNRQINGVRSNVELFYKLIKSEIRIRTATVLYRKSLRSKIAANSKKFLMGDTPLWLDISQLSKFHYIDQATTVYRVLEESASRSKNIKKSTRFQLSMREMRVYYCYKYGYSVPIGVKKSYNWFLLKYLFIDPRYEQIYNPFEPSVLYKMMYSVIKKKYIVPHIHFQGKYHTIWMKVVEKMFKRVC